MGGTPGLALFALAILVLNAVVLFVVMRMTVDYLITSLDRNLEKADQLLETLKEESKATSSIDTEERLEHSDFDKRIAQFQEELNTPTYEGNDAKPIHPSVYNIPHNSITDVPIRFEEEYAK